MDVDDFINACIKNQFEEVSSCIKENPNIVHHKNRKGWTGLMVCCFNNHVELAKFLVNKGAGVNDYNIKGTSVLMYAKSPVIQQGCDTQLLSYLLEAGANINHKDNFNKTVLDYCVELDAFELSKWLIGNGALASKRKRI